mmetsp:Transcript_32092/g.62776  ORF Transcript_32092/g.62776 Transcript_32092/m.62776 type:complete len:613 (+) Transcript_32092:520-2358(+)
MAISFFDWFNLTQFQIIARPLAPVPDIYASVTISLLLKDNPYPLEFWVEGGFSAASVIFSGAMSTRAWINPFGIRGLVLKDVGLTVGFGPSSPIGINVLGLLFSAIFDEIVVYFSGELSLDGSNDNFLIGCISKASDFGRCQPKATDRLSLRHVAKAIRTMSNGAIDIPDSWLPGPDVLSLAYLYFSIADSNGVDLAGRAFSRGFHFSADVTLFGIGMKVKAGSVTRSIGLPVPVTDFVLDIRVSFEKFNEKLINWIKKIIPFNIESWLGLDKLHNLCQIACFEYFGLTDFSVIDMITLTKFPSLEFRLSLVGKSIRIGPLTIDVAGLKQSIYQLFDRIRKFFDLDFCVISWNCDRGYKCKFPVCRANRSGRHKKTNQLVQDVLAGRASPSSKSSHSSSSSSRNLPPLFGSGYRHRDSFAFHHGARPEGYSKDNQHNQHNQHSNQHRANAEQEQDDDFLARHLLPTEMTAQLRQFLHRHGEEHGAAYLEHHDRHPLLLSFATTTDSWTDHNFYDEATGLPWYEAESVDIYHPREFIKAQLHRELKKKSPVQHIHAFARLYQQQLQRSAEADLMRKQADAKQFKWMQELSDLTLVAPVTNLPAHHQDPFYATQ